MSLIAAVSDHVFDFSSLPRDAERILVKPNLGYAKDHPITVSTPLLVALFRQLRSHFPQAQFFALEGTCCPLDFSQIVDKRGLAVLLPFVKWIDANQTDPKLYKNQNTVVYKYPEIEAPMLISEVDICISLAPFKRTILKGKPLISGTVKNLFGLLPTRTYRARSANSRGQLHVPDVQKVIADVYGALGSHFHLGIVDLTAASLHDDWHPDRGKRQEFGQVIVQPSLIEADLQACAVVGEEKPIWASYVLGA
jgi:uncharacterized protein (DUF362 family)